MINGNGDHLSAARDGNLSSIISRIRDDGPAASALAGHPWVAKDAEPPLPDAKPSSVQGPQMPEGAAGLPRTPDPSPLPDGPPRGAGTASLPTAAVSPAKRSATPMLILALVVAAAVTAAVLLALHQPPPVVGQAHAAAPPADGRLGDELAALQVSIAVLSERVETIGADGQTLREAAAALGERLDRANLQDAGPDVQRLEVQIGQISQRVDSVAEHVARLLADGERAKASTVTGKAAANLAATEVSPVSTAQTPRAPADPEPSPQMPGPAAPIGPPAAEVVPQPKPPLAADPGLSDAALANPSAEETHLLPVTSTASVGERAPEASVSPASGPAETSGDSASDAVALAVADGEAKSAGPPMSTQRAPTEEDQATADFDQDKGQQAAAIREQQVGPHAKAASAPEEPRPAPKRAASAPKSAPTTAPAKPAGPDPWGWAPATAEQWFVHLIAVSREATALDLQRAWRGQGVETEVVRVGRGNMHGLRVGGFPSRAEAAARAEELKLTLGIRDAWISQ